MARRCSDATQLQSKNERPQLLQKVSSISLAVFESQITDHHSQKEHPLVASETYKDEPETFYQSVEMRASEARGRKVRLLLHEPVESELREALLNQKEAEVDESYEEKRAIFRYKLKLDKQRKKQLKEIDEWLAE